MKKTQALSVKEFSSVFSGLAWIALLTTSVATLGSRPALAGGGHFKVESCGVNHRDILNDQGVKEIYKGAWSNGADATPTDAFLIRYFDGKQEIYLTSHNEMDKALGILFYDVYNQNERVTPVFLSFGIDSDNNIVGDTSPGYEFSATLAPTHSTEVCAEAVPPPAS